MAAHHHSFLPRAQRVRLSTHSGGQLSYTVSKVSMTDAFPARSCGPRPADLGCLPWHKLIVFLSIASLSITLAGRVFHQSSSNVPTIRANAENAKIQHRDRVAHHWSAPLRAILLPAPPTPVARMHTEDESLLGIKTDACLYNRPPPRA